MELPFERSLYFLNKEQERRKKIIVSSGRRCGNFFAVLKQITPPDTWKEFVKEYNKQRKRTVNDN